MTEQTPPAGTGTDAAAAKPAAIPATSAEPTAEPTETPAGFAVPQPAKPALEPAIIVIFGITGDLSKRYLLPAIYRLVRDNLLHEKTEIIGVSRRELDLGELFDGLKQSIGDQAEAEVLERLRQHTSPFQLNMDDQGGYAELRGMLDGLEAKHGVCMNRLYYLSVPPAAYGNIIGHMAAAGLNSSCQHGEAKTRLLAEKPFGTDLASAQELIDTTSQAFSEDQVFRIDHYLAKETAQNILTFRFDNPLFEAVWDNRHVAGIDIVASEKLGIEGRATFYEGQGALRDFVQNHLLQLLAIATMDKPQASTAQALHQAKLELLQAIRPITAGQVASQSHRGQYQGYRDEVQKPDSHVETFAAIETAIDSPRWQDVPITIRTGKALADKRTVITFTFKDAGSDSTNDLQFRIQPDEGIAISLVAKKPGLEHELQPVVMDFSYERNFDGPHPDAYERVLADAVRGDNTLFTSSQEVLAAWRVVDAVVHAWQGNADGLRIYEPGTPIDEL